MGSSYLDQNGLKHYTDKMKQALSPDLSSYVPVSRKINGKPLSSNITLNAADVAALSTAGGTLNGNLTLKGSRNYGTKLNLGDGDYVHISESVDDCLEIKANKVNFLLSQNTDDRFTINSINPFQNLAELTSNSITTFHRRGTNSDTFTIKVSSPEILENAKFMAFYSPSNFFPFGIWIHQASSMLAAFCEGSGYSTSITISMSGSTITAKIVGYSSNNGASHFNDSISDYYWLIM